MSGLVLLLLGAGGAWAIGRRRLRDRMSRALSLAAALARRNVELHEARERVLLALRRMERLQDATAALAAALDRETLLRATVTESVALSGADTGAIFRADEAASCLELLWASDGGDGRGGGRGDRIPLDTPTPVTDAVRSATPLYLGSPDEWHARYGTPPPVVHAARRAWAALPLVVGGRAGGALLLAFRSGEPFEPELRACLEVLARQCGHAFDRVLLYEAAVEARAAAEAAQREVQRANDAKSRFLAMMSHELRTPLNAIGGYAELIELGLRGPVSEGQREDLLRIQRSKRHLVTIIDELLDHACIEAGQLAVHLRPVSVRSILEEVEALMALDVASRGLHLVSAGCDTDAIVLADHEKLCRVLANLLANAIRFTPAGGSIRLDCETRLDVVRVRVADTGIGIPADRLEAIFEPFTQLDDGLTRRTGGTGLGLTISREFVAAMGGTIAVSSTVGAGSAFTVTLPRVRDAAPAVVPGA